jgi:putative Mg2+ transporter-C (MgtC) family protein
MLDNLLDISPLNWTGIICAMIAGAIIGLERQIMGKPAGIRTSMLICIGTYIFVEIAMVVSNNTSDSSRIIGQVATGIGFLGAGVMLARDGLVYGVTSAAVIWTLAAIGVVIGSGHEFTGIKIAVLAVIILIGVDLLEDTFKALQKGVHGKLRFIVKKQAPQNDPQGGDS